MRIQQEDPPPTVAKKSRSYQVRKRLMSWRSGCAWQSVWPAWPPRPTHEQNQRSINFYLCRYEKICAYLYVLCYFSTKHFRALCFISASRDTCTAFSRINALRSKMTLRCRKIVVSSVLQNIVSRCWHNKLVLSSIWFEMEWKACQLTLYASSAKWWCARIWARTIHWKPMRNQWCSMPLFTLSRA